MELLFITLETELTNLVYTYSGSQRLKTEMLKRKINYSKVEHGAKVSFVLRHKDIKGGKLIVTL